MTDKILMWPVFSKGFVFRGDCETSGVGVDCGSHTGNGWGDGADYGKTFYKKNQGPYQGDGCGDGLMFVVNKFYTYGSRDGNGKVDGKQNTFF